MRIVHHLFAAALVVATALADRAGAGETVFASGEAVYGDNTLPKPLTRLATENSEAASLSTSDRPGDYGDAQGDLEPAGFTLLGLNFTGDHEFDGFIEPVTNPVFFEDPRSRTRLRLLFINQIIPGGSILGRGDFQVYASQLTVALNNRLSFIAQKDGWIALQADGIKNQQGWADLAAGLKYVLIRDVENQFLVSGGVVVEWSNGSGGVFQGNGGGVWNFFLSVGKEFGECGDYHFVGTLGWHLPNDNRQETESLFYSAHLDRRLTEKLYVLWELTGIQYLDSGRRLPGVTMEGGDLINLGAGNVDGNTFVSTAFGFAYKFSPSVEGAFAYEFPITSREDLMENRITATLSFVF